MGTTWTGIENRFSLSRVAAAGIILLALVIVPAPLLPPHRLAEAIQSLLGVNWKTAYLAAVVGVQGLFYAAVGLLSTVALRRASTIRGRLLQIVGAPLAIVGTALLIRSLKAGHLPVWVNAAVPVTAAVFGVWLGLGLLYQQAKTTSLVVAAMLAVALWSLLGEAPAELSRDTEASLQRLVVAGMDTAPGDTRFGALMEAAFARSPGEQSQVSAVRHNRAAILALGVAIGDERLARMLGLKSDNRWVRAGVLLRDGTTLRGRNDWSRHFFLSAALAVLEHPLLSDAGGLMKEQMDALGEGSGFSFGDLAADRAGVRFAVSATGSEAAARSMLDRLQGGFRVDDFFPPAADLPENLTVAEFRREYGRVGSQRYRRMIGEIEGRLDSCSALVDKGSGE